MSALTLTAFASLFILGLMDNVRGPFYPDLLQDFAVHSGTGSLFFALTSLCAFFGSFFAHRFEQRWSSLHVLIGASMAFSLGFVAIALAPSWPVLCVASAFFGLAFGALNLSQNTLVLQSSPGHLRRQMMNGLHSMYGLAALAAPVLASLFRSLGLGWRMTFLIFAVLPWVLLFFIGQYVRQVPRDEQKPYPIPLYPDEWKVALFYGLMVSGYLWGEIAVTTRLVQWLRGDMGYGPLAANFFMGGFCGLLLAGRVLFSLVHFPMFSNLDILRLSSFASAILFFMGLKFHPVFLMLAGLSMAPFFPVAMDQINSQFGDKSSQALGFVIGFASLSVVLMHVVIGWTTDAWGLTRALYLCAGGVGLVYLTLQIRARRVVYGASFF